MATYDNGTDSGGDFWAQEDAKAVEDAKAPADDKRSQIQRILRAKASMVRERRTKNDIDGFPGIVFGSTKSKANQDSTRKMKQKEGRYVQEEQEEISFPESVPEPVPLTQQEIEQHELEALKALVEGMQPVTVPQAKNAGRSIDPTSSVDEAMDLKQEKEVGEPITNPVGNDDGSDPKELEIKINHYIEMLEQHNDMEEGKRQGESQDLMSVIKDVERKHEQQLLKQHRKQNGMYDTNNYQIWDYVGEYYTGGANRPSNPTRVAPSPENMLRRMKPMNESKESREARLNKLLHALNSRMAKQAAARRQHDDNEFENLLQNRQMKKNLYDERILLGLLQDLAPEDEKAELNPDRKSPEENLASTLEKLDEDFYEEIRDATKGEYNGATENRSTRSTSDEEEGGFFDHSCLGMGRPEVDLGTINGVPRTVADTTNVVDSQNVAYTPDDDQFSDASEDSTKDRAMEKEDPPDNGWFSFFSSPPPKEPEAIIPQEIVLEDPQEARQEPEGAKPRQHIKKGLKIVAILEGDEEIQVGSATKPVIVEPEEVGC